MNIAEFFVRLSADNSGLKKGMAEAQGSVSAGVKSMTSALGKLGIAFGGAAFLNSVIRNSIEAQDAMAQLAARVQSTGGAAGRSVAQLDALSVALQRQTTFGDEAIKGAESLLLTFKKIRGDEFDRATKATLDLATAMGGDLNGAALQLGKALEDPTRGLTALRRSGVSFTESQQAAIKAMVEAGNVAGAQNLILAEMESQFGGAAEAARDTLGGALKALGNAWGDQLEISRESSSGTIDAINGIADALPHLRSAVDFVIKGWQAVGIHAAVAVEQLELAARAMDPRRLWSSDAQAAFEQQKETLRQITEAAADMMFELENGAPGAADGVRTLTQNMEEAAAAAEALDQRVKGLRTGLAELGKLPSVADILSGSPADISGAKAAADDFLKQAAVAFGSVAGDTSRFGVSQGVTPGGPRSGFAGPENPQAQSGGAFAGLLGGLGDFAESIGGILAALSPWKLLLDAVGRALGDFLTNMTPIVELLATAFMPILKALFPVFKLLAVAATYVGQVFFTIAGGILKAIGYLVKGLGALIEKLPGVGDFGLKKAGQSMIDLGQGFAEASDDLGDARDQIKKLEWKDAVDPLTKAANETAAAMSNVPSLFNANLARFRATGGGASISSLAIGRGGITITGDITVVANDPETLINKLRQKSRRGGATGIEPAY